jgi:hypothetical protein
MLFAAFPIVFQEGRGWDAGKGGLAFLGIGLGMIIGVAVICNDNSRYVRIHRATGGYAPPECRLPPVIFGGGLIVIGISVRIIGVFLSFILQLQKQVLPLIYS